MLNTRANHTKPSYELPVGATDCHIHVFGRLGEYAMTESRNYTPAPASLASYTDICNQVGLARVVFVQPSVYGFDNSAILDAIAAHGLHRSRGVAAVDIATVSDADLTQLYEKGVRGLRLFYGAEDDESISRAELELKSLSERIKKFSMHVQLLSWAPVLSKLKTVLAQLPVPVVIDHLGRPKGSAGTSDPAFQHTLELGQLPHVWVKLSAPYRISDHEAKYLPFFREFLLHDTDRLLWGSDWPHPSWDHSAPPIIKKDEYTPGVFRQEDFGTLLNTLELSGASHELKTRILVENPAKLYGFSSDTI